MPVSSHRSQGRFRSVRRPRPRRWARSRTAPLLLILGACAPGGVPRNDADAPVSASPRVTAPLPDLQTPRSWQGELPCADCAGIRTTLSLAPDGSYHRTDAYLGKAPEADTLFGGIGRWILSGERIRIELLGSGEGPVTLVALEGGELQVIDRSGNPPGGRDVDPLPRATGCGPLRPGGWRRPPLICPG